MLTKKTLEIIKLELANEIQQLEEDQAHYCIMRKENWRRASPDSKAGKIFFNNLNCINTHYRRNSSKLKKLRLAQKEVKTAIAYHVEWARYVNETTDPSVQL